MTLVMSPPAPLSPNSEHLTALRSAWPGDHLVPFLPAAMNDSCPPTDPGNLTQDVDFKYEVVQGFFVQNGPRPKYLNFHQVLDHNFGLVDTSPARWSNLKTSLKQLQANAKNGEVFKVLFLGRHGQGWHNFASHQFGTEAWDSRWTFETTDGNLTWGPDPELTPLGQSQATAVYQTWLREAKFGAPVTSPNEMKWYVSPMHRACQTMIGSFGKFLPGVEGREGVAPEVWEDWREVYGSHTCDQRSTKAEIAKRHPEFIIEESFVEHDELWTADDRECSLRMQQRGRRALDRLFGENGAKQTFISITSHSQFFLNLLAVLNHQPYPIATGEMIPVVVKATPTRSSAKAKA